LLGSGTTPLQNATATNPPFPHFAKQVADIFMRYLVEVAFTGITNCYSHLVNPK